MKNKTKLVEKSAGAMRLALRLCFAIGALGLGQSANADTAVGSMAVTATVASSCTVGASTLPFGTVTSAAIQAANQDAVGTVSVNCTTGSKFTVALGLGVGTGATMASRKMTSTIVPATLLNYSIYTTSARTTVWGDGTATSTTVTGTGTGSPVSIDAFGRIFSGQIVPALEYRDTVSVTVTY